MSELFDKSIRTLELPAILQMLADQTSCEAARAIRALDRPDAGATPIIAVTANAFAEDVAATAAAGMDAHISKPIDFAALRRLLGQLLPKESEN